MQSKQGARRLSTSIQAYTVGRDATGRHAPPDANKIIFLKSTCVFVSNELGMRYGQEVHDHTGHQTETPPFKWREATARDKLKLLNKKRKI